MNLVSEGGCNFGFRGGVRVRGVKSGLQTTSTLKYLSNNSEKFLWLALIVRAVYFGEIFLCKFWPKINPKGVLAPSPLLDVFWSGLSPYDPGCL